MSNGFNGQMGNQAPQPNQMYQQNPMQQMNPAQQMNPMYQQQPVPQGKPLVDKSKMAYTALGMCVLACILIVVGYFLAARDGAVAMEMLWSDLDFEVAEEMASAADTKRVVFLGIAALLNFAAFVMSLIALIKARPKMIPAIIFAAVIILPNIAMVIGNTIQNSIMGF
ncbi:MAG: hypothetical protein Q4E01_07940 [Actinomycetaceae bacterium]|nr:hypothetical protein [Actinomycetaceae bacterium]